MTNGVTNTSNYNGFRNGNINGKSIEIIDNDNSSTEQKTQKNGKKVDNGKMEDEGVADCTRLNRLCEKMKSIKLDNIKDAFKQVVELEI